MKVVRIIYPSLNMGCFRSPCLFRNNQSGLLYVKVDINVLYGKVFTQQTSDPLVCADNLFPTSLAAYTLCWGVPVGLKLQHIWEIPWQTVQIRRRCCLCSYHAFQCCLLIELFLPCGITMFVKTYLFLGWLTQVNPAVRWTWTQCHYLFGVTRVTNRWNSKQWV